MHSSKHFNWVNLLLGILGVVLAYMTLVDPVSTVISLTWIVGLFLVIDGVLRLFNRSELRLMGMSNTGMLTFSAILNILFGLLILFMPDLGITYIWMLVSTGFIIESLFQLFTVKYIKEQSKGLYWFTIIISILGIILGIFLLLNPVAALGVSIALLSAYFLCFGMLNIVFAF